MLLTPAAILLLILVPISAKTNQAVADALGVRRFPVEHLRLNAIDQIVLTSHNLARFCVGKRVSIPIVESATCVWRAARDVSEDAGIAGSACMPFDEAAAMLCACATKRVVKLSVPEFRALLQQQPTLANGGLFRGEGGRLKHSSPAEGAESQELQGEGRLINVVAPEPMSSEVSLAVVCGALMADGSLKVVSNHAWVEALSKVLP